MSEPTVHKLEKPPSEKEVAQELRQRLMAALGPVGNILVEARCHHMMVNVNFGFDAFGQFRPVVTITKELAA